MAQKKSRAKAQRKKEKKRNKIMSKDFQTKIWWITVLLAIILTIIALLT